MHVDEALRTLKNHDRPATERIDAAAALGRSDDPRARQALQDILGAETDQTVRDAISTALRRSLPTVLGIKRPKLDKPAK